MHKLCECGCGQDVRLTTHRFVRGHNRRKPNRYEIRDCGYETPCWVWLLQKTSRGYGKVSGPDGKTVGAHRYYFQQRFGYLPPILHHLCKNPSCVNPNHLLPVTSPREHVRSENRTHCRRGHSYQEYLRTRTNGTRFCVLCDSINRARKRRQKNMIDQARQHGIPVEIIS